jgi:alpha-mannosidase
MARNKKYNRKAEFLYTTAEWISSLNSLLFGTDYPADELRHGWKNILLNQFHDVLPGSSVKEVYEDSDQLYADIFHAGNRILAAGLRRIADSVTTDGDSVVVFNPLSWDRAGLVEFSYHSDAKYLYLTNKDGMKFICRKADARQNQYIAMVYGVFSKGYSTFRIIEAYEHTVYQDNSISMSANRIENKFFIIGLNEKGQFTGVYDKRADRNVLKPDENGNVLQAFEDKPMKDPFWGSDADNWNLDIFYDEKMWEINDAESIEIAENGPLRGILRIKRRFINSTIIQDIIVYSDIPRIDFKTVIDWKEKDIIVKTAFPLDIHSERAAYEIQYGYIERDTHRNTSWDVAKYEVYGHKWADLSEDGYGVSLLNDCKYGYDVKEGVMRLTLLRSGTTPNIDSDRELHEFTYSLYPHIQGWREGKTVQQAYDLNCPLLGIAVKKQNGCMPVDLSFVRADCDNVIVEAIKKSEDGNETIVRIYEAYNRRGPVKLNFYKDILNVTECNLIEADMDACRPAIEKKELRLMISPLEIKTYKINFLG